MPVEPSTNIAGILIMGDRTEPFLGACLESLADALDLLVVNINGKNPANRQILEASRLSNDGKVVVVESDFNGFSYCRNLCLEKLKDCHPMGNWVLYVDSDEVHRKSLVAVTRRMLPNIGRSIGTADGYFYNFFQSPKYYTSLDRRHNMLFRLYEDSRWEGDVHERFVGNRGERIALPYSYCHYGYMAPSSDIAEKWRLYGQLGDTTSAGQAENSDSISRGVATQVLRYRGQHPPFAADALRNAANTDGDWMEAFELMAKSSGAEGFLNSIYSANFEARLAWRALQFGVRFGSNREIRSALHEVMNDGRGLPE